VITLVDYFKDWERGLNRFQNAGFNPLLTLIVDPYMFSMRTVNTPFTAILGIADTDNLLP
jgi:hypothetical protein